METMDGSDLTQRQKAILDYIGVSVNDRGYPPSIREIGQAVGLASPSTVHTHLHTLEQKGYVRRDPTKPRALVRSQGTSEQMFAQVAKKF